jgi:hypothetical protein
MLSGPCMIAADAHPTLDFLHILHPSRSDFPAIFLRPIFLLFLPSCHRKLPPRPLPLPRWPPLCPLHQVCAANNHRYAAAPTLLTLHATPRILPSPHFSCLTRATPTPTHPHPPPPSPCAPGPRPGARPHHGRAPRGAPCGAGVAAAGDGLPRGAGPRGAQVSRGRRTPVPPIHTRTCTRTSSRRELFWYK